MSASISHSCVQMHVGGYLFSPHSNGTSAGFSARHLCFNSEQVIMLLSVNHFELLSKIFLKGYVS